MVCGNNLKVYLVGGFSALGGFLFGYHTGVISGVLTMSDFTSTMHDVGDASSAINGGIVAVLLFGCFLGSLIGGQTSDRFSRKRSISIFSTIFTISAALQTASVGLAMLLVARFVAGVSIGALSMIVPIYHSEIATTRVRGRLITLQQWAITIGIAISFWINYATHNSKLEGGQYEWRIPLGLQIIPSSILAIGILFCPYSPRWLMSRDREEDARNVLRSIRGISDDEIEVELRRIATEIAYLRENEIQSYRQLYHFPLLRPFILGIGIQILQQCTGINSTMYYAPKIFIQIFPNSTQSFSLLATGINGCINVIATIPTIIFIDKLGRRVLLIAGGIIMTIALLIVAGIMAGFGHQANDPSIDSPILRFEDSSTPWIIIVFIYVFVAGFAFSWGPIPWIYCTEIFPLTMRAKATSITTASNWAANCAISFLVPILLESIQYGTFIIFSIFCAVMTGLVILFYPETKNQDLEHIDINQGNPVFVIDCLEQWRIHNNALHQPLIGNERNAASINNQNDVERAN